MEGTQVYQKFGIRFLFPGDWEIAEQQDDDEVSITVSSPGTSFWSVTLDFAGHPPEQLIESACTAFREEYDDLDIYQADATLCGRETIARDIDFVCLELTNSAFLRAFRTARFTVLVLYQETDHLLDEMRPVLEDISRSLNCDEDAPDE